MSLLVRGGRLLDPATGGDAVSDVLLADGVVRAVGPALPLLAGAQVLEAAGRVVCPGFIDIHTHLREPGYEYKETIATGTRAAAAGGFTAVCCMANTHPVNDHGAITDFIRARAATDGVVRVHPIGAVTRGLEGRELAELAELAEAGCVAFSDDGQPVRNAALYRRAMEYLRPFGRTVISHAEDPDLARGAAMHEGRVSAELGIPAVPAAAEDIMVARDILLAELTGARVHIAHVSTAGAVALVRAAKARGVRVTAEVTPHHLVLTDDAVRSFDPNLKMNPPLRSARDADALVAGLLDGTLDCVATDHAPHAESEKEDEFDRAAFGIVGLETAVSVLLDRLVATGRVPLPLLVERLSAGPARVLGLPGGTLAPGAPADLTLLDLEREVLVEPGRFRSRSRNTPFGAWRLRGAPVATIVGGSVVLP